MVVQVKVPGEFFRGGIVIVTAITFDVIGGEKTDRHNNRSR